MTSCWCRCCWRWSAYSSCKCQDTSLSVDQSPVRIRGCDLHTCSSFRGRSTYRATSSGISTRLAYLVSCSASSISGLRWQVSVQPHLSRGVILYAILAFIVGGIGDCAWCRRIAVDGAGCMGSNFFRSAQVTTQYTALTFNLE